MYDACATKEPSDKGDYLRRSAGNLSRREFGTLSLGTGLVMLLPRAAGRGPRLGRMVGT